MGAGLLCLLSWPPKALRQTEARHRGLAQRTGVSGEPTEGVRASVLPGPVGAEREEALSPMKRRKSPE